MDTRLQIVERLYSEGEDNHVPPRTKSGEGEDLSREFQAMSQAKFWMDHRRRQRPDAAVVDRVVAAAAAATRGEIPGVVRPDRSPLRLLSSPRVRLAVAATLVIGVVGLGVWRVALEPTGTVDAVAELEEQIADKPALAESRQAGAAREEAQEEAREGLLSQSKTEAPRASLAFADADPAGRRDLADDSSMLMGRVAAPMANISADARADTEWDETDEVVRLHQRIDRLRLRQINEGWDRPMVPLEEMPTGRRDSGIRQAGSSGN